MRKYYKRNTIKDSLKLIILACVGAAVGSLTVGYATGILFQGDEVSYDNSSSGLESENVQDALDELCEIANESILDKIYPVGSIYLSTSLSTTTDVANALGGTWEVYGQGRTLIGAGTGTDTNSTSQTFSVSSPTGGVYTVNLAHSHTVDSHTHTLNNHTHTINSHTHTLNNHTHTINSHTHTLNNHTHGTSSMSAAIGAPLGNATGIGYIAVSAAGGNSTYAIYGSSWETGGQRSHNTKIVGTTDANNSNTGGSGTLTTNANNSNTGGSGTLTTNANNSNSGAASPGTDSKLSSTQSIVQPYTTVYMYKRIS